MSARHLALEALKKRQAELRSLSFKDSQISGELETLYRTIAALEAEIAQAMEPVGQVILFEGLGVCIDWVDECPLVGTMLYTAPPEPAVNAELLEALKAIVPFIPKTTAKDGGAALYSANVVAADMVRAAIAKAEAA